MSVHLIREIENLKKQILALGADVESALHKAVNAIVRKDWALAQTVIDADTEIDRGEVDIEEECLKILALYQPVAIDLRFIIAVLKINNDLERIGDLAVNIAEQVQFLGATAPRPFPFDYEGMAGKAQVMLKKSLDALVNLDAGLARQVCASDDEVDAMYRDLIGLVKNEIRQNPDQFDVLLTLLMVSRQLERIADHATNIAEDVIYMIDGHIVRHSPERVN